VHSCCTSHIGAESFRADYVPLAIAEKVARTVHVNPIDSTCYQGGNHEDYAMHGGWQSLNLAHDREGDRE
jgi:hypothetical protein